MPRNYTPHVLANGQTVRADKLHDLGRGLEQAAGDLIGEQIPSNAVTGSMLGRPTGFRGQSSEFETPLNSYRSWASYSQNNLVVYPLDEEAKTNWFPFRFGFTAPVLTFGAGQEGVLTGELIIDSEMRISTDVAASAYVDYPQPADQTQWREYGVFVNGRLIASTGRLFNGRETTSLSFASPTAGGEVRVEVYSRVNFGTIENNGGLNIRPMVVHGMQVWARRNKR